MYNIHTTNLDNKDNGALHNLYSISVPLSAKHTDISRMLQKPLSVEGK